MKVKDQKITDKYAIYNGDCVEVLKGLDNNSIGFSVYSPPFSDLFSYSDSDQDMGNCRSYEEFFTHYEFLVAELARIMMPGRVVAVHCMDLPRFKQKEGVIGLNDFPGDIIRSFEKHKFIFHSRHVIWKDPLIAAVRTHAIGLAHQQIVKDSSMCRTGIPDMVLAFRKDGDNPIPIAHPEGLSEYVGENQIPRELMNYKGHKDPKTNKLSHWIWQQYASPTWLDCRPTRVLPYKKGKDKDDEKHICPLSKDIVERCLVLWSAPNDVVLSPFAGIGTEVYEAVRMGRRAIGVELKPSYYKQMVRNLESLG